MHGATILLTGIVSVCIAYFLFAGSKIRRNGDPLRWPPNTLPLAGNGLLFLQARHKLFSWFVKCERQFGFETFQISVPSLPPGVVINDPKNLEFVLKNEAIFAKGEFFRRRSWDLFGNGIINADGDLWKIQRKAGLNFLSKSNLKVLTDVVLPKYLMESIQTLQQSAAGSIIDLESIFHELTTQLMSRMAYNMEIHNSDPFSRSFEFASGATGKRFQNPLWQITEIFFGKSFREAVAEVKEFGSVIVANAIGLRHHKEVANESESRTSNDVTIDAISGSLITSLLDSIDDQQIVADAALNYLSAGRDTTAQALTWAFYLLMRHPHVVEAIREELDHIASPASDVDDPQNHNSLHLDSPRYRPAALPYVMAVFYETLRLYPPVPFEIKQCEQATTLPDGTYLPKSAIIVWCTWAMNRSRETWGKDADDFKPQRWLVAGNLISKTAFEFPVFHGGSRTCLGKKMAEVVAVQVIATLIRRFDFEAVDCKERISKNSLTLPMEGGLPCRVKLRPST